MSNANPDTSGLVPFKGSGNPGGGSKRRTTRKQVRGWIESIAEAEIPPNLLDVIRDKQPAFYGLLPPGVTFGFAEALRLHIIAVCGKPAETLAALALVDKIIPEPSRPPAPIEPALMPSTEELRQAMAEELGVDLVLDPDETLQ
jgi:hypothetical protein